MMKCIPLNKGMKLHFKCQWEEWEKKIIISTIHDNIHRKSDYQLENVG